MRPHLLHWLINLALPMAMLLFAWGCGGVATLVTPPKIAASTPRLRPPATPSPRPSPTSPPITRR